MIEHLIYSKLFSRQALAILLLAWLAASCNITKTVPEGDALFTGYDVEVNEDGDTSNRKSQLETELSGTVRPKPNSSFLGLRPGLWIYNTFYTEKDSGFRNWIQEKLGTPPVLLSEVDTTTIADVMHNRLHNRGYFNNTVGSSTTIENKKAEVKWTANVGEPYRIRKIEYTLNDSLPIHRAIKQTQAESLLKAGDPYDLQTLTEERIRIDEVLRNKGYFYFSPDLLIFSVDSSTASTDRQVDILLRLKNMAPAQALDQYTIDDIYIFANYITGDTLSTNDTINFRGYHYIPNENYVRARHLLRGVFIEHDSLYSRENHVLTISRLMGLSAYKFVNVNFEPDTLNPGRLDAFIYLTPAMKKSLRLEGRYVSKSNNFAGPGLTASFRNRNAFKGSELLTVELTGRFESQIGGRGTGTAETGDSGGNSALNSYEIGLQTNLTMPRIVSPIRLPNLRTEFVPKTRIGLGFNFLNRVQFFQMNSFNASYAYNWRPTQTVTHDITPINLQYVRLARTTEEFREILAENPFLRRSFENQFIIGSIYQNTISTQMFTERTHRFFNNFTIEGSGNLVNALHSLTGADEPTEDRPRTLLGQQYSQYIRLENDFRYYLKLGEESMLATRFLAGVGYAYGNSTVIPYVRQFSIGGPNSIRAFRARSVGPGSYNVLEDRGQNGEQPAAVGFSFFDQTGDIKLETSIEYRFPVFGFVKGAVFADAGNIWLRNQTFNDAGEPDRPGGQLESSTFLQEVAVGTGFGVRVDIEFFVIRLDFGIPVRVPYMPEGERFVLDDFRFGLGGDNGMVLNIAIGYPF